MANRAVATMAVMVASERVTAEQGMMDEYARATVECSIIKSVSKKNLKYKNMRTISAEHEYQYLCVYV